MENYLTVLNDIGIYFHDITLTHLTDIYIESKLQGRDWMVAVASFNAWWQFCVVIDK